MHCVIARQYVSVIAHLAEAVERGWRYRLSDVGVGISQLLYSHAVALCRGCTVWLYHSFSKTIVELFSGVWVCHTFSSTMMGLLDRLVRCVRHTFSRALVRLLGMDVMYMSVCAILSLED